MKKSIKKAIKRNVVAFSCSCGTCSGCSNFGYSGGAVTAHGAPK